ncbi:MAG: gamma-glutamyl-gamma-aminobutyrate hydrolase family protein [Candidatus Korobacteraceae bacterium]|jgi:putative glutamine amidotransferase
MRPRIAIPVPNSTRIDYVLRALPQYERAVRAAGGEPVVIDVKGTNAEIAHAVKLCDGLLLPGSPADVDPEKYGAQRHPKTARADARRDNADELLLQDAYNMRKPVFAICYGVQSLNVWRTGTLDQELPSGVKHEAGKTVLRAHIVQVDQKSKLASILHAAGALTDGSQPVIPVNSNHHQAPEVVGDGLRLAAWCPEDGVKEAVEGTTPDHFVLGVQWHPERTYEDEAASRALFRAFIKAAAEWHEHLASQQQDFESVGKGSH